MGWLSFNKAKTSAIIENVNSDATEHLESFRKHLEIERGLKCWQSAYKYQIFAYVRFLEGRGVEIAKATRDDVVAFLEEKKKAGCKASTLFIASVSIRLFHRFLVASGRATGGPVDLKLPKFSHRLPQPLTLEEMERLLGVPTGGKFHRIRLACVVTLAFASGLRSSELMGLEMADINLADGWVRVKNAKGGKERVVPFGEKTKAALSGYFEARARRFPNAASRVFLTNRGRPWTRTAFWWQLKKLAREAGLSSNIHPHMARHGFATALLAGGASLRVVQEGLSHSDVSTTQRYTHVLPEQLKKVCETVHPRF